MKTILVTGSGGLIGSEVSRYFLDLGWRVVGIDNDQRSRFFGPRGTTRPVIEQLATKRDYHHIEADIRNRSLINEVVWEAKPAAIVHTAAQPSHDLAATIPFDDFETNALGTLNLLEACRQHCPEAPFVHMSTNKVYGDGPNNRTILDLPTRFDALPIDETFPIDQCMHSLFGASKLAADILVQEYGRYFGMPTACLRGGCLTGPAHAGVQLHGFLSYLIQCNAQGGHYTVFGHKGKQVRDNLHAFDVAAFIHAFIEAPRVAEVYNLGGGKDNACSIVEAFSMAEAISGNPSFIKYEEAPRKGDHIHYVSDLTKCKAHYPNWSVTIGLQEMFQQIYQAKKAA